MGFLGFAGAMEDVEELWDGIGAFNADGHALLWVVRRRERNSGKVGKC